MFRKKYSERITINSEDPKALIGIYDSLKETFTKNCSFSKVTGNEEEWQFSLCTDDAEQLYDQLHSELAERTNLSILLEFNDRAGRSNSYAQEVLLSMKLASGVDIGNEEENRTLRAELLHIEKAHVAYEIIGGGAVTVAIPCENPDLIQTSLTELMPKWASVYQATIADRRR